MPGPVQVQSLGSYLPEEQTYAGPLMGGGANMKELNKWIDDRISMCPPYDSLRLLLGLLKVACQHYGKLRSQNSSVSSKVNHFVLKFPLSPNFRSLERSV